MQQRSTHLDDRVAALDPELSEAIANGISVPLSALRASMESLARGLVTGDPRATLLHGALDEVVRMGRNVQALLDIALPPPLRPLDCTLEEIAQGALQALGAQRATRVLLAIEDGRNRLFVDGPLLSSALSHVIEAGLCETSHPVLVSVRCSTGRCVFSVLYVAQPAAHADASAPSAAPRSSARLGLELARRLIRRMGGELGLSRAANDQVLWLARLPCSGAQEAA